MDVRYLSPHRRVSESQSEASSSATEISEYDIAAKLGVEPSLLEHARFKVDRKKLEDMIQSKLNDLITNIMKF